MLQRATFYNCRNSSDGNTCFDLTRHSEMEWCAIQDDGGREDECDMLGECQND